jgi:hypothetical protein
MILVSSSFLLGPGVENLFCSCLASLKVSERELLGKGDKDLSLFVKGCFRTFVTLETTGGADAAIAVADADDTALDFRPEFSTASG